MRIVLLTTVVLMSFPALTQAQSLGDQDTSGRFEGMPPGTDRYRGSEGQSSFAIPLGIGPEYPKLDTTARANPVLESAPLDVGKPKGGVRRQR